MEPLKEQEKVEENVKVVEQGQIQAEEENNEENKDRKDPETLSQGQRMGLSKQQLRKLEKNLAAKKKKQLREIELAKQEQAREQKAAQKKVNKSKDDINTTEEERKEFNSQKIILLPNTKLPGDGQDNVLVTSALPYVNNVPHLGNIIGCVLSADVFSRYKKLQGSNVLYICGTDEYGTATQVKALQQKKTPQEVCDFYFKIHAEVYKWFDIGFDYFGRTSTEWHTKITQEIFLNIQKADRILKEKMTQCYCENCDLFLADRFVTGFCPHCNHEDARGDQCDKCGKLFNNPTELKDYRCQICKKPPILRDTVHFFIDLPKIQQELQTWIEKAHLAGEWSDNSITITRAWTKLGLKPKCITRDLKWGVTVPIEEFKNKVFYVWFDAPIGYISITANLLQQEYKKWWINQDVKLYQFMGKDNVPFHTVIFPSSLIASGQGWTLLHHISTTEYLNYQSGKFSKTRGTGVFGTHTIELQKQIPPQVWRYYLLVNRPEKSDSEFSWKDFIDKNNNELLANLGNLVHRVLKYIYKNYNKKIPAIKEGQLTQIDEEFIREIQGRYNKYRDLLNHVEIKEGLKLSMQISSRGNKYLQQSKFWEKENQASGRTDTVISVISNFIRFQSFLVEPYIPSTSAKINYLLGLGERNEQDAVIGKILNEGPFKEVFLGLVKRSNEIKTPILLFQEYTDEQADTWRKQFKGTV